jgi:glycosyltransferase involved in cell wall biosynthesis
LSYADLSSEVVVVKVSVCIPVFNCQEFIEYSIRSVLNQSFKDFELIIIDNCSTDKTLAIIESFSDPRLKLHQNSENIGFCGNWNLCLKLAKGQYVKILPADDLIEVNCLEQQVQILEIHQGVSLVACSRKIINESNKFLFVNNGLKPGVYTLQKAMRACALNGGNPIGEPGGCLFRREVIDKGHKFVCESLYCIDLNFWSDVLKYGNLLKSNELLAGFRLNRGSSSVKLFKRQIIEQIQFVRRMISMKIIELGKFEFLISIFITIMKSMVRGIVYFFYL